MLANRKMILRPFIAASMVLALVCGSSTAAEKIKLDYIPADAVGAVVVMPNKLSKLEELEMAPWEVITAAGEKAFGFDPLTIEQAIVFVQSPKSLQSPPGVGAVIQLSAPFELAGELVDQIGVSKEKDGVVFYREKRPDGQGLIENEFVMCVVERKTILLSSGPIITNMLASRTASGPLHELLAKTSTSHHVTAVAVLEPMREFIDQQLTQLPPLPLPLNTLRNIPTHLESIELNLSILGPDTQLKLNAVSVKSAQDLERIINNNLAFAKQLVLVSISQQFPDNGDVIQQATRSYLRRMVDVVSEMVTPVREDMTLVLRTGDENAVPIATTGVVVALLLPAIQAAREAARRTQSKNNLRQIMLGMHGYHDAKGSLPAAASYDKDGKPLLSWRVHLLPRLGQEALYRQFHLDEPWDSNHNRKLIPQMPAVYINPNVPAGEFKTNYLVVTGKGMAFDGNKGRRFAEFSDGTSNTIMLVEANSDRSVVWTKPADLNFNPDKPFDGLGDLRPGGFMAARADASVSFYVRDIDLNLFRALMTRSAGDGLERGGF